MHYVNLLIYRYFQALQHVFHKSGYNYTKRTSSNFMNYMLSGPGIVIALGEPPI